MNSRSLRKITWMGVVLLALSSAASASISAVTPQEGTIGTALTITGSGFGEKKGAVALGKKSCQVLTWSDTSIECSIKSPLSPGAYDLVVKPRSGSSEILSNAFSVMPPSPNLPPSHPQFVTAGETFTITGDFLGGKSSLKKIVIEDLKGKKKHCKILSDTMDSVTFQLPKGLAGIFSLRYSNGVSTVVQPFWGTFQELPDYPLLMGSAHSGAESQDCASAVIFLNKMWVFWPDKDKDSNHVQYQIWNGSTWSDTAEIKFSNGAILKSKAPLTPVVANGILYLFLTSTDGILEYLTYNPKSTSTSKWTDGVYIIYDKMGYKNATVYQTNGRFAAANNFVNNTIEVYWTPDNQRIYMAIMDLDQKGQIFEQKEVVFQKNASYPTLAPYLTAVFNQNEENEYVTYLSWDDTYAGAVSELKDGVELYQSRLWYWSAANDNRGPSLVDLGEDYLAVMYNHLGDQASYQKYDKNLHTIVGCAGQQCDVEVDLNSQEDGGWAPNGVTFSLKVADGNSPTGYRMNSYLFAFVENNPVFDEANWEMIQAEFLGFWLPVDEPVYVDFLGSDLSDPEEINERLSDTFPLWPILGIVDMPPYVLNGNEECDDCTRCCTSVELEFSSGIEQGLAGEYSAGAYVETGKKSPVTLDVSAGYTGGFDKSTSFTYIHTDSMESNQEGRIFAYYLAPSFNVYTLEWFNTMGEGSGVYMQSVEVVGAEIRKETFEPTAGPVMSTIATPYLDPAVFPVHASQNDHQRLLSYDIDPTASPYNFTSIASDQGSTSQWAVDSSGGFGWIIDQTHSVDNGGYIEMKIGAELAHKIGFGVEGSFEIHVQTTTQYGVEAITALKNQSPADDTDPNRVDEFSVDGYWLKPSSAGYWVPEYRQDLGDAPWFITFRVTDFWPLTDESAALTGQ